MAALLLAGSPPATARTPIPPPTLEELQVLRLLQRIETALSTSDRAAWLSLISANADPDLAGEFFDAALPRGVTRAVVRERDRVPLDGALPGDGYRLVVEVFVESGPRGQLSTWRLDIRRPSGTVAVAGEPTRRGGSWPTIACRRWTRCIACALDRERTYTAQGLRPHLGRLRAPAAAGQRLRRQHGRRRAGAGPDRRRPAHLQADAEDRARAGAALRRRRRARDPLRFAPSCGSARTTSSSTSTNGTLTAAPPDARALHPRPRDLRRGGGASRSVST